MTTDAGQRWSWYFTAFLAVNLVAASVNHIDDTDETYGYWEPMHYLLFGTGMQTWEYSPEFAIRTYSFIYPLYKICSLLSPLHVSKVFMFRLVRGLLGTFTAYSEAQFVVAIGGVFGTERALLTAMFLLCAPGVFLSSTALLPSAVAGALVMLSCAAWLRDQPMWSILWGCVAVLWTGWPFVGLLFAPLGVHMVAAAILRTENRASTAKQVVAVLSLLCAGALIAVAVCVPAALLDRHFYNKWTSPSLNILLYNAVGGSGDELYGVEPAAYYAVNLLLTTGLAWPMALLAPLMSLRSVAARHTLSAKTIAAELTLSSLAAIWLGVLFSRPHKEERFLYPVYPAIAFVAAGSLQAAAGLASDVLGWLVGQSRPAIWARKLVMLLCFAASVAVMLSRTVSNFRNYGGYIALWTSAGEVVARDGATREVSVCTGGEWHQFPSHFFLPPRARLAYVRDGFGGILPQHFAAHNGTWAPPLQPFNDRNREEEARYVPLDSCDYLVLLVDRNKPDREWGPLRRALFASPGADSTTAGFAEVARRQVISAEYSRSPLARAFYVPRLSERSVQFQDYVVLRKKSAE